MLVINSQHPHTKEGHRTHKGLESAEALSMQERLRTGVFPFDVGQVGRAGVADGQTLLGHGLSPVHVQEVGRHRDLRTQSGTGVRRGGHLPLHHWRSVFR